MRRKPEHYQKAFSVVGDKKRFEEIRFDANTRRRIWAIIPCVLSSSRKIQPSWRQKRGPHYHRLQMVTWRESVSLGDSGHVRVVGLLTDCGRSRELWSTMRIDRNTKFPRPDKQL